jgi:ankyrin repeat protein
MQHMQQEYVNPFDKKTPYYVTIFAAFRADKMAHIRYIVEVEKINVANYPHPLETGESIIRTVAMNGKIEVLSYLLEQEIELRTDNALSAMHYAAEGGQIETMEFLGTDNRCREQGITFNITARGIYARVKPMHMAAKGGQLETLKFLHHGDALPKNERTSYKVVAGNGMTCMHYAAEGGHPELMEFLHHSDEVPVDERLSYVGQDRSGKTPLHHAAFHGHTNVIRFFIAEIKKEGNEEEVQRVLHLTDNNQETALHQAVRSGNLEAVQLIYSESPGLLQMKNKYGSTPLALATEKLKHHKDYQAVKQSPIQLEKIARFKEIKTFLEEKQQQLAQRSSDESSSQTVQNLSPAATLPPPTIPDPKQVQGNNLFILQPLILRAPPVGNMGHMQPKNQPAQPTTHKRNAESLAPPISASENDEASVTPPPLKKSKQMTPLSFSTETPQACFSMGTPQLPLPAGMPQAPFSMGTPQLPLPAGMPQASFSMGTPPSGMAQLLQQQGTFASSTQPPIGETNDLLTLSDLAGTQAKMPEKTPSCGRSNPGV